MTLGLDRSGFFPCAKPEQFTALAFVDDLHASHVDELVVDEFIEWCRKKHEDPEIGKIKPSRGKIHDYLGITLDYSSPGKVKLHMKDYVKKMLDEFPYPAEIDELKKVQTPAATHLFAVNPKAEKLDSVRKEEFHTTVAKGLF